jgi:hypothetical protein
MKNSCYFWILLLLLGCKKGEPRAEQQRIVYPALNESPPPPPPPLEEGASEVPQPNKEEVPSVITGQRWIDLKEETDDMVKRIRDYSEKADPDDPFALKEEEIRKLADQEGLRLY